MTAISPQLRHNLTTQTSDESLLSAGEVYFHILRCDPEDTERIDGWLARLQTSNSVKEVQSLYARQKFNAAFARLAKIPAFGPSMLVGNIRVLMGLKCDEEIVHYLNYVYSTWSFFLGADETAMARVDRSTVEQLQSRSPANCREDRGLLEPLIEQGVILRTFDRESRQTIWDRLLTHRRLIPSLQTFFEDLKYLRDLDRCIRRLIRPARLQTVRQALRYAFARDPAGVHGFDQAYRRLWLYAMRHLEDLRPGSVLLESCERVDPRRKTLYLEHGFAREARSLGFESPEIDALLETDPDRIEIHEMMVRTRPPSLFIWPDDQTVKDYIEHSALFLAQTQPKKALTDQPTLIEPGSGESDLKRRCGRPYSRAFEQSARFLTLEHVHMAESIEIGGLSTFFIRRDVYLSFFGPLGEGDEDCIETARLNLHQNPIAHDVEDTLTRGSDRYQEFSQTQTQALTLVNLSEQLRSDTNDEVSNDAAVPRLMAIVKRRVDSSLPQHQHLSVHSEYTVRASPPSIRAYLID